MEKGAEILQEISTPIFDIGILFKKVFNKNNRKIAGFKIGTKKKFA